MKKLLKLFSIVALIMTVTLTACKKNETPTPTPDPTPTPGSDTTVITNAFVLDGNTYNFKNALSYVDNIGVQLVFTFEGLAAEFELDGSYTEIPTGTFELTKDGKNEGEVTNAQFDYDLIGTIIIAKEGNVYTVSANGTAVEDNVTKTFSMTYQGEIVSTNEPQGEGDITFGDKKVNLLRGMYSIVEEQGIKIATIILDDMNQTSDDSNIIAYTIANQDAIPTGTFTLSPLTGTMAVIDFYDEEYVSTQGTLTISKEGDVYTITSQGNAIEYGKETFSSTYTGKLLEVSMKK